MKDEIKKFVIGFEKWGTENAKTLRYSTSFKQYVSDFVKNIKKDLTNQLKDKAHEMDFGGYVKAVLLDDILAVLSVVDKVYVLKKDCPKIGKEIGDYYNGEYAESIEELLAKGVIEEEI